MTASHSVSGDRSVEPTVPSTRCCASRASGHRPVSAARSRRPRSAPRCPRCDCRRSRYRVLASSLRLSRRASWARCRSSVVAASSAAAPGAMRKLKRPVSVGPRDRRARTETGHFTDAVTRVERRAEARRDRARLARGHPLLFLDHPLAADAMAREGQRLEPFLGDRFAAPLARAERAVVQLLERRHDVPQKAPVAVAQLEEKLPRIRGVRLVAEVLDRVVFLIFYVEGGSPDLLGQLPLLLDETLFEVREPILSHLDLLPYHDGAHSRDKR